ncbi:MAG: DUF4177 domain-containing protein [Oscillospiraceae bacterium]|nr:DUF4177 domain-containing protein [Oscillospiraceae bacterium]
MYEYKTEIVFTETKWFSDKANKSDVDKFDQIINEKDAAGWELVTYSYMATSVQVRGALLVTFRRKKGS